MRFFNEFISARIHNFLQNWPFQTSHVDQSLLGRGTIYHLRSPMTIIFAKATFKKITAVIKTSAELVGGPGYWQEDNMSIPTCDDSLS